MQNDSIDNGIQPLDVIMSSWNLENTDLVNSSTEQLTHKQVQKARGGRRMTLHSLMKVTRALNVAIWNKLSIKDREIFCEYSHKHLFNYIKEPIAQDPNQALRESIQ